MIIFIPFQIYDKLTILSEKQLNAEGLVSSGVQKVIKEIGHREGKENTSPPLSGGRGKKKEK